MVCDVVVNELSLEINKIFESIVNICLSIIFNIHFVCSKEPSHQDDSLEYPQHMFWLRHKKIKFQDCQGGALVRREQVHAIITVHSTLTGFTVIIINGMVF